MIIEKLDHNGRGVTHINGKVAFIENALPEENVEIKIKKEKKKYLEGITTKIITPSPNRIKPLCDIDKCGCNLKHLNYTKQLEYKKQKVEEILHKFCKIDNVVNDIIKSDDIYNYRNKVTLKVNHSLGYYQNKTNKFIKIRECLLVDNSINKLIKEINKLDLSNIEEVIIKSLDKTMVIFKGKNIKINNLKADSIYLNDKLIKGEKYITYTNNDLIFTVSDKSFFQVNTSTMLKLYNKILDLIKKDKEKTVLDLYCGTGTIGIFLARYFKNIIGIEINESSVKCANINKKTNNINNIDFICDDASNVQLKADIIVVDPPRSGLSKECVNYILSSNAETIIYVSCDPVTLARDINMLNEYKLISVTPVDMFPQTTHVETVALMSKKNNN